MTKHYSNGKIFSLILGKSNYLREKKIIIKKQCLYIEIIQSYIGIIYLQWKLKSVTSFLYFRVFENFPLQTLQFLIAFHAIKNQRVYVGKFSVTEFFLKTRTLIKTSILNNVWLLNIFIKASLQMFLKVLDHLMPITSVQYSIILTSKQRCLLRCYAQTASIVSFK